MSAAVRPRAAFLVLLVAVLLAACATPTTPTNIVWDPETQARIITQQRLQAECISPVWVYKINGDLTSVSAQGFYVEAGEHELEAQAFINTTGCPVVTRIGDFFLPPMKGNFQAGATYYIGVDHRSPRFQNWHLRVWKIECVEGVECLPGDSLTMVD